ncbi:hypothetical protein CXB51_036117 [Gossypium anomalum]|uniref:RNase H type-1 domain-containing protein n=1 Tax=Gossypium anomalum TaxID=47600 RepID=A0A8J6CEG6_9ROSI|nr:hypothetical protein CXB51_036117 [Gossypium anomalum]
MFSNSGIVPYRAGLRFPPPPAGWITINCDGAVKGAEEKANAGGLLRDRRGTWIVGYSRTIGVCSVLTAELSGIMNRLLVAWDMGFRKVQVECEMRLQFECLSMVERTYALFKEEPRFYLLKPPAAVRTVLDKDGVGGSLLIANFMEARKYTWRSAKLAFLYGEKAC